MIKRALSTREKSIQKKVRPAFVLDEASLRLDVSHTFGTQPLTL